MHYVLPATQGLRTAYALMSDRLWFGLAVIASLLVANKLTDLFMEQAVPVLERGFHL